jgi:hypothetical protein
VLEEKILIRELRVKHARGKVREREQAALERLLERKAAA